MMKLGLGTVQFGLDYGVTNKEGIVSSFEISKILDFAYESGIRVLDTASLYGLSENVLGKCIKPSQNFKLITKTPKFSNAIGDNDVRFLRETFYKSLSRLKMKSIYGLLVHSADDLLGSCAHLIWNEMLSLKEYGLVKKIGVSVYSPDQLNRILNRFPIDLVQLPINVLDQRFLADRMLERLKERGVEVHARSIFLQGLLLIQLADLSYPLMKIKDILKKYQNYVYSKKSSSLDVSLGFVNHLKEVDHLIVGVCSLNQLDEIINSANTELVKGCNLKEFACFDEQIVNPSLWKLK